VCGHTYAHVRPSQPHAQRAYVGERVSGSVGGWEDESRRSAREREGARERERDSKFPFISPWYFNSAVHTGERLGREDKERENVVAVVIVDKCSLVHKSVRSLSVPVSFLTRERSQRARREDKEEGARERERERDRERARE
jgi:hypothetical protein